MAQRQVWTCCDNLLAAQVVTADGKLVREFDRERRFAMGALKGGSGNFGVVTSLNTSYTKLVPCSEAWLFIRSALPGACYVCSTSFPGVS